MLIIFKELTKQFEQSLLDSLEKNNKPNLKESKKSTKNFFFLADLKFLLRTIKISIKTTDKKAATGSMSSTTALTIPRELPMK